MSVSYGKSSSYDFAVMISAKYAKFGIDMMKTREIQTLKKCIFASEYILRHGIYSLIIPSKI